MMHLEIILTLSGIGFISYYSLQPNMVFEAWLLYWAKRTLENQDISYKGLDSESLIDIAVDYNKWIKPLGYCSKCFAPWFLLPFALSVWMATEIPLEQIVYIYVTSIIITICLAVKV